MLPSFCIKDFFTIVKNSSLLPEQSKLDFKTARNIKITGCNKISNYFL